MAHFLEPSGRGPTKVRAVSVRKLTANFGYSDSSPSSSVHTNVRALMLVLCRRARWASSPLIRLRQHLVEALAAPPAATAALPARALHPASSGSSPQRSQVESREGSQTVRLKAQKADLGGCRKFSDEIFETGFQKQRLKLNLESAFMFPEKYREGRFWGTS